MCASSKMAPAELLQPRGPMIGEHCGLRVLHLHVHHHSSRQLQPHGGRFEIRPVPSVEWPLEGADSLAEQGTGAVKLAAVQLQAVRLCYQVCLAVGQCALGEVRTAKEYQITSVFTNVVALGGLLFRPVGIIRKHSLFSRKHLPLCQPPQLLHRR